MKIPLRKALWLAVGPANVDAAGHAVADWFDGRNCSGAADQIREHLQDQPAGDAVPHNRPDTSLRSELMAKLATQREVLLNLCNRVDRLEMRADGLTPIERVERRWAMESAGGDKLDRLIAQDKEADGPAVPEGREPAAVVEEPSDRDLRQLYADTFDLRSDPASLGPAIVKFARAVLARWGHQPAPWRT